MAEEQAAGRVWSEREDRILKIVIDNPAKRNAFVAGDDGGAVGGADPSSIARTSSGSACSAPRATISPPGSTCRSSSARPPRRSRDPGRGNVDPFGMRSAVPEAGRHRGAGHHASRSASRWRWPATSWSPPTTARFCQMEAKRGIAPLGGAHFRFISRAGWGDAMYHLMLCDEFGAAEALPHRPGAGGRAGRPAGRAGDGGRADHRRQRAARRAGDQGGRPQVRRGRRAGRDRRGRQPSASA